MTECMRPDCVAKVCDYEAKIAKLEAEVVHKDKVIDVLANWYDEESGNGNVEDIILDAEQQAKEVE